MLRIAIAALVAVLAVSPIGFSAFPLASNDAAAGATMKPTKLMPGKSKVFMSGSEFRVCNEGDAEIHVMAGNSITDTPTESYLKPGNCVRIVGSMMTFKNDSQIPVMLYAFGGLGGRPGRGPGKA
jgi:hypothetical protein